MHPRQRSKCVETVAFSVTVPSSRASIRWMRPRGESISSRQRTYVGHVGRQKPQCTQSAVYSLSTGDPCPRWRLRYKLSRADLELPASSSTEHPTRVERLLEPVLQTIERGVLRLL